MKLSIITINYNNKAGLEKTIASVMSQTWRDFEWILIDGGSTDGSKEVIENLAKNPDSNISYWCSEPDKGIYNAMNKGIAKAKGEYLQFLNSGDCLFESKTLKKVFLYVKDKYIYYGDFYEVFQDREIFVSQMKDIDIYKLYHANINHQTIFVPTSIMKHKRFDETYKIVADYKRWIDALLEGFSFKYIKITICKFEMGGISDINKVRVDEEISRLHTEVPAPVRQLIQELELYKTNYFHQLVNLYLKKYTKASKLQRIKDRILDSTFKILNKL